MLQNMLLLGSLRRPCWTVHRFEYTAMPFALLVSTPFLPSAHLLPTSSRDEQIWKRSCANTEIVTDTAMTAPIFEREGARDAIEALHPFQGIGAPKDIVSAVVFLALEDNSQITGVMMPVDGGYTAR